MIRATNTESRWGYMNGLAGASAVNYDFSRTRYLGLVFLTAEGLVTRDMNLNSVKDMKGKRVSYGQTSPGSDMEIQLNAILKYYGMANGIKDVQFQYMSFQASADALKDGRIDVTIATAALQSITPFTWGGAPYAVDLASSVNLNYVSFDAAAIREGGLVTGKTYFAANVPPGALRGQTKVWTNTGKYNMFACELDVPDYVTYEIAKISYNYANEFKNYIPLGAVISKDTLTAYGASYDLFHPGFQKFMTENNLRTTHLLAPYPETASAITIIQY